jgi:hypothetical protein
MCDLDEDGFWKAALVTDHNHRLEGLQDPATITFANDKTLKTTKALTANYIGMSRTARSGLPLVEHLDGLSSPPRSLDGKNVRMPGEYV